MDIRFDVDHMSLFASLMVLRHIRDWAPDADIAAFEGNVEKQYDSLFDKFKSLILDSGLFDHAHPDHLQRKKWLHDLSALEQKLSSLERPLTFLEGRDNVH